MEISKKIILLSAMVVFGLTPTVYSKDYRKKLSNFRTNFLDKKVRNMGYDFSGSDGDDYESGYAPNYSGEGWKHKKGVKGFIGRVVFYGGHRTVQAIGQVDAAHGNRVDKSVYARNKFREKLNNWGDRVRDSVKSAKVGSSNSAKGFKSFRERNGRAAGLLWEKASSFNPETRNKYYSHWDSETQTMTPNTIFDNLDNSFESYRNIGVGDTAAKQFTNGYKKGFREHVSRAWKRVFKPKTNPVNITTVRNNKSSSEVPIIAGFQVKQPDGGAMPQLYIDYPQLNVSSPQTNVTSPESNVTAQSLLEDDIKNSELTPVSTVNETTDNQIDISGFSNKKIIKDLQERRKIPFVTDQTLANDNVTFYTQMASEDDPDNGQILYVADKDNGFAVEYKDSEPLIMSFDDGRKSVFLSIDEDLDAGSLKVKDSNGVMYDYRENYVEGSKVMTIQDPLPVEFSNYIDKNGGHFKQEGAGDYYHVDKNGENKKLVFTKEESSRGTVFVNYDTDSSEGVIKPKSAIFANGGKTVTFSEVDAATMVDSDGVEWSAYPLYYYSQEADQRVDYISLNPR